MGAALGVAAGISFAAVGGVMAVGASAYGLYKKFFKKAEPRKEPRPINPGHLDYARGATYRPAPPVSPSPKSTTPESPPPSPKASKASDKWSSSSPEPIYVTRYVSVPAQESDEKRKEREETERRLREANENITRLRADNTRAAAQEKQTAATLTATRTRAQEAETKEKEAAAAAAAAKQALTATRTRAQEAEAKAKRLADEKAKRLADLEKKRRDAEMDIQERADKYRREAEKELGMDTVNSYNIGFCGETGTGKSSLINAIRDVSDGQEEAAKVGETETTRKITPYPHPEKDYIVLWDIPGGGSVNNPAAEYFWEKKLYAFDKLLVVGSNRFKAFELDLAKTAHIAKIPVAFIRSKMDVDIRNRAERERKAYSAVKDSLREEVAQEVLPQLEKAGLASCCLFTVSSRVIGGHPNYPDKDFALDEKALLKHVCEVVMKEQPPSSKEKGKGKAGALGRENSDKPAASYGVGITTARAGPSSG